MIATGCLQKEGEKNSNLWRLVCTTCAERLESKFEFKFEFGIKSFVVGCFQFEFEFGITQRAWVLLVLLLRVMMVRLMLLMCPLLSPSSSP